MPQLNISQKGATKRLIASEASKHTGRPMSNKAAKKWLRKSRAHGDHIALLNKDSRVSNDMPRFRWPQVREWGTSYAGMASFARFPNLRPLPFGWKRLTLPNVTEAIDMPLFLWWGICAKTWLSNARSLPTRVVLWCLGLRRVAA